jgi:pyruvate kinase
MRRTKIVCTIGPAVETEAQIAALINAGMNVARLNFSHGTHEDHLKRLDLVRSVALKLGKPVAILQDLCGPKIRIGVMEPDTLIVAGQELILTSEECVGNATRVHLPIPELHQAVGVGDTLMLDDGLLELKIIRKTPTDLVTMVIMGGVLGSKKGINVPGVALPIAAVTDKDEHDVEFGIANDVDYIALSFVKSADDVRILRWILQKAGKQIPIIVKIEKFDAVKNLESILLEADGAMVARGDLGVEMPLEEVAMVQKQIIRACNRLGKPVITATQMLNSMIENPRPTRAEVTDIANAVIDGTDALMLSGETAVGAYPISAVETMARIAVCAENELDYELILAAKRPLFGKESITDAVAEAAVTIAQDQNVVAILCATATGGTARAVAKFRPKSPIYAATTDPARMAQMNLYWGVVPVLIPPVENTDEMIARTVEAAIVAGYVREGDLVVITSGSPVGVTGNTNLIKVHRIGQPL